MCAGISLTSRRRFTRPVGSGTIVPMRWGVFLGVALLACGSTTDGPGDDDGSGGRGEEACTAGRYVDDQGNCREAGTDPEDCGAGFEGRDRACFPILPPEVCTPGQMALAGEMTCRGVAPSGDGRRGDGTGEARPQSKRAVFLANTALFAG